MFQKFKIPLIGVGIVVLAFIIYQVFFSGSGATTEVLTSDSSSTSDVGQAFVTQLAELQSITLSPAIFSDPVYTSLVDFSQPIPDYPLGRENPFAPVSGIDAGTSTYTSADSLQFNSATSSTSTNS